jgi:hypothetical protein
MFHDQRQTHCMGFIKGVWSGKGWVKEKGQEGGGVRRGRARDRREGIVE